MPRKKVDLARDETTGRISSKLTPELSRKLVGKIKSGMFDAQIAISCGVHPRTLWGWLDRGIASDCDEPYTSFALEYLSKQVDFEEAQVGTVLSASDEYTGDDPKMRGDWKAAAWWLERKSSRRWGPINAQNKSGGEKDSYQLPEPTNRGARAVQALANPSPEMLRAIDAAGWQLVRKAPPITVELPPALPPAPTPEKP